ncbi:MAG TPA: rhomboid family intramembrane serine protease [Acidimicrobiales bacterium]|nr:rhomboid family intramembrane serine protease [Acidimicrobiales bacterium]
MIRYRPGRPGAPSLSQAPVTLALIGICIVVYLATSADQGFSGIDPQVADRFGLQGYLIQFDGQWYRIFTSIFLHESLVHVGLNMFSLFIVGRVLEPALGWWRYLALFLVCGVGGAVGFYLFTNPLAPTFGGPGIIELSAPAIGASGAIFGLFGAYFILARRAAADTSGIVFLIVLNLIYGFVVTGIAWQDHIGGLITGLAVAGGFGLARGRRPAERAVAHITVLVTACIVLALLMLLPAGAAPIG